MEKNRRYVFGMLILLLFAAAFAWMIHVGFPGTGGTVVAMAILTFAIVVPFVERASAIPRHLINGHISLLADILLLAGAAYLIVAEPGRLSMTFYLVAAGGLVSLIYWIADLDFINTEHLGPTEDNRRAVRQVDVLAEEYVVFAHETCKLQRKGVRSLVRNGRIM